MAGKTIRWTAWMAAFLFCTGLYAQSDLDKALKARYSFDLCDGTDDTGNRSDGEVTGARCDCGVLGESLYFNGKDDFIEFRGNVNEYFKANNFTISFYFRPNTTAPNTVLLSKYESCTDETGFLVQYGNGSVAVRLKGNNGVDNSLNIKLKDKTCWTHLAVVRRGPTIEIYENGKLIGRDDNKLRNTDIENSANLRLGMSSCSSSLYSPFRGNVDELRIYNIPLDELQIRRLLAPVDVILTQDTVIARGTSFIPAMSVTCASEVEWSPSTAVSQADVLKPSVSVEETTTLEITYNYGSCRTTDLVKVRVVDSGEIDCDNILMPRAFTPNDDNLNDRYGITVPGAIDRLISFEIYNPWNELVFRTESANETWDGTFKGKKLNPGGFLYKIHYQCAGREYIKTGEFLLFN